MKKIFTLLTTSVFSMAVMATNYTGNLIINNETLQQDVTASIENNTITLNGVTVTDCAASTVNGVTTLVNKTAVAQVVAHYGYDSKYAVINMTLADGTTYHFENVGDAFQIPNSNFETWTASSGEPQHWHGFKSASGGLAKSAPGSFGKSTDKRPGSTGTYSAVAKSGDVFGIVGNGTFTNGQLNAGNMSATNTTNHSHMDVASTAVDKDGNPFYTAMLAKPDALKTWFKFSQAKANTTYPYATISAILFDGTYYQDPENKTYTNVAGKANNKTIAVTDWTEISIPFNFEGYTGACKAILVTMSTNATPGKGSSGDQIWADDLTLVYNAEITGVTYKEQQLDFTDGTCDLGTVTEAPTASDFAVTYNGASATAGCAVVETEDSYIAYVYAVSGDLLTNEVFTVVMHKEEKSIPGDVNGNGEVNVTDINATVKIILNQEQDEDYKRRADVNGDNTIDIKDVNAIVQIILNKQ